MAAILSLTDNPGDLDSVGSFVVLGRREQLLSDRIAQVLPGSIDRDLYERMVNSQNPGDHGRATSTWLSGSPGWLRVGVLPEVASRHNSPTRAWGARPAVLGLPRGDVGIVVALEEVGHAFALVLEIARNLPTFSAGSGKAKQHVSVLLVGPDGVVSKGIEELTHAATSVRQAANWVDQPPNMLNTNAFVAAAKAVAEEVGASVHIVQGDALREQGLNGIYGVGKGARQPPALVVLDHDGDAALGHMAWVGKGIVYDTGGLSIKSKTGMPGMKADMGGAAAVLAAFHAACKMGHRGRLTAAICIAENAVSRDATRPDDILRMYSGRTVEINNTDAEGRLVLADGVAWISKHREPDTLVDMATLTGAQAVSTGQRHGALYCSSEDLELRAVAVGKLTGDLVHPLPYAPEFYRQEFGSAVADMKNSVKARNNAQSSCAGQFIGNHLFATGYEGDWLHIDMSGPATRGGRATGWGVGLLLGLANCLPSV